MDYVTIAKEFGWPVTLIIFFVWWSYMRETSLRNEIQAVQLYVREKLSGQLEKNTVALVENTDSQKQLLAVIAQCQFAQQREKK